MSEVLSRDLNILPADERQSLRFGRFLFRLARADKALYQAKAAGRNQVTALG